MPQVMDAALVRSGSHGTCWLDGELMTECYGLQIVVNKTTDSVTTGTNYLTLLQFMGIETVVVTGIVTDQRVACTVRGLADAGYKVICVEDACAAGSMELHDAELKIMNVIYCDVLSTDETIALIEKNL